MAIKAAFRPKSIGNIEEKRLKSIGWNYSKLLSSCFYKVAKAIRRKMCAFVAAATQESGMPKTISSFSQLSSMAKVEDRIGMPKCPKYMESWRSAVSSSTPAMRLT